MTDLVARARDFATLRHGAQLRKYTGLPYTTHLSNVVGILSTVPVHRTSENLTAAAWLHDVLEDTPTTFAELCREFGPYVAGLVAMVTDVSKSGDGNRAARKARDRDHLADASPAAKTIKLADLIDNTRDIIANDPKFSVIYLAEKRLLLPVLKGGDAKLWSWAYASAFGPYGTTKGNKSIHAHFRYL